MKQITFITGNQNKADYLARELGYPIVHRKLDLDEIQSLDLREVVEHKVRQAYGIMKSPVLVEDVSLEFGALGRLPGTYIKWFESELGHDGLCRLLDSYDDRSAVARGMFGYYDGKVLEYTEGALPGQIALEPKGINGFGWDPIFIPEGHTVTRAELDTHDNSETYRKIKPITALKEFLETVS